MIARLRFPPLIVTLALSRYSWNCRRLTRGIENYFRLSQRSYFWQGYVGGLVPAQLFILIAAIGGGAWWLHRTTYGGSLLRIGFSAEGARYAASCTTRLSLVYIVSVFVSSLAAIIYVAHLGQAK